MYFLDEATERYAIFFYRIMDESMGDELFHLFGPGNVIPFPDKPFERFSDYENLLKQMRKSDRQKYEKIHKGTPFYFLAWTAFDLRNYEKALFYIDAAISEDIKNANTEPWLQLPASKFRLLLTSRG